MTATSNQAFALGYLRVWQIVGDRKRGIEAILPIGRSTFLAGVKSGKYPKPVKLGERTTAWRKADIMALLEHMDGAGIIKKSHL
ncbi:MAG: AlpA family phage regulatory protein [Methylococcales bacterium]|nr:AlpA family phage regulatory protein [Methylococcales bacterium]